MFTRHMSSLTINYGHRPESEYSSSCKNPHTVLGFRSFNLANLETTNRAGEKITGLPALIDDNFKMSQKGYRVPELNILHFEYGTKARSPSRLVGLPGRVSSQLKPSEVPLPISYGPIPGFVDGWFGPVRILEVMGSSGNARVFRKWDGSCKQTGSLRRPFPYIETFGAATALHNVCTSYYVASINDANRFQFARMYGQSYPEDGVYIFVLDIVRDTLLCDEFFERHPHTHLFGEGSICVSGDAVFKVKNEIVTNPDNVGPEAFGRNLWWRHSDIVAFLSAPEQLPEAERPAAYLAARKQVQRVCLDALKFVLHELGDAAAEPFSALHEVFIRMAQCPTEFRVPAELIPLLTVWGLPYITAIMLVPTFSARIATLGSKNYAPVRIRLLETAALLLTGSLFNTTNPDDQVQVCQLFLPNRFTCPVAERSGFPLPVERSMVGRIANSMTLAVLIFLRDNDHYSASTDFMVSSRAQRCTKLLAAKGYTFLSPEVHPVQALAFCFQDRKWLEGTVRLRPDFLESATYREEENYVRSRARVLDVRGVFMERQLNCYGAQAHAYVATRYWHYLDGILHQLEIANFAIPTPNALPITSVGDAQHDILSEQDLPPFEDEAARANLFDRALSRVVDLTE